MMPAPEVSRDTLSLALDLGSQGYNVFPLRGRLPAIAAWPQRASNDPDDIRAMWTRRTYDPVNDVHRETVEDYNIGICTSRFGDGSECLIGVDVDVKNGKEGLLSLQMLDFEHGTPGWLETRRHRSASGGQHYIFRSPTPTANTQSKIGKGIDTRGQNGFLIAPGSVVDGRTYEVEDTRPPALAPKWLIEAIGKPLERASTSVVELLDAPIAVERARSYLAQAKPAVEGDGGDAYTYEVACKVGDYGVSELTALQLMLEWNERCQPPWDYEELAIKVGNAYAYRKLPLGQKDASADFEAIPEDPQEQEPLLIFAYPADLDGKEPPEREWLAERFIPKGKTTLLSGDGGVGKTLAAQQLATAVATGADWYGLKVRQGKVLAVFSEDDTDELWRRQIDINAQVGVDMRALQNIAWWSADHVADTGCVLMTFSQAHPEGKLAPFFKRLARAIETIQPSLVILDPIANMFGGSELDRAQVTGFTNRVLNRLCVKYGITIVGLIHPSVTGMQEGSGRSGSTGWANAVRSRLYLTRDKDDPASDLRVLKTTKANYGRWGDEIVLEYRQGAFKAVASGSNADPAIRCERGLLAALRILEDRNEMVSHSNRFRNYYARRVMTMPEMTGFNQKAIEEAFERLRRDNRVEVSKRIGTSRHIQNGVFVVRGKDEYERPSDVDFD